MEAIREMARTVLIQVKPDLNSDIRHRHAVLNDFVIPEVKALPGFQGGTWTNDGVSTGTCVVLFDSEDNARSARQAEIPMPQRRPGHLAGYLARSTGHRYGRADHRRIPDWSRLFADLKVTDQERPPQARVGIERGRARPDRRRDGD
jgi:hypothetical protein